MVAKDLRPRTLPYAALRLDGEPPNTSSALQVERHHMPSIHMGMIYCACRALVYMLRFLYNAPPAAGRALANAARCLLLGSHC